MLSRIILIITTILPCIQLNAQADTRLRITPLTGNFYIYTTWNQYKDSRTPANGMYLVTSEGVVLFDCPWDTTQFQPLLDSIETRHHQKVKYCIATHFHDDRTAGLTYYKRQGINTYTTRLTDSLSALNKKARAANLMYSDTGFTAGEFSFQVFYPGPGHAPDNIIIWFPKEKILYGGCLIKSTEDKTLGYLGDASTELYANSLMRVKEKCHQPAFVIPGHGSWKKKRSLNHTLRMARKLKRKSQR